MMYWNIGLLFKMKHDPIIHSLKFIERAEYYLEKAQQTKCKTEKRKLKKRARRLERFAIRILGGGIYGDKSITEC